MQMQLGGFLDLTDYNGRFVKGFGGSQAHCTKQETFDDQEIRHFERILGSASIIALQQLNLALLNPRFIVCVGEKAIAWWECLISQRSIPLYLCGSLQHYEQLEEHGKNHTPPGDTLVRVFYCTNFTCNHHCTHYTSTLRCRSPTTKVRHRTPTNSINGPAVRGKNKALKKAKLIVPLWKC